MNESTTKTTCYFTPAASLAALGVKLNQLNIFGPIRKRVQIVPKTVKQAPIDKLYDGFISLLAGAHGLGEIKFQFSYQIDVHRSKDIKQFGLCQILS